MDARGKGHLPPGPDHGAERGENSLNRRYPKRIAPTKCGTSAALAQAKASHQERRSAAP
jgi:hypothetical protein